MVVNQPIYQNTLKMYLDKCEPVQYIICNVWMQNHSISRLKTLKNILSLDKNLTIHLSVYFYLMVLVSVVFKIFRYSISNHSSVNHKILPPPPAPAFHFPFFPNRYIDVLPFPSPLLLYLSSLPSTSPFYIPVGYFT